MTFTGLHRGFGLMFYRGIIVLVMIMAVTISPCMVYSATGLGLDEESFTETEAQRIIKKYITEHSPWEESQIKIKNISVPNNIIIRHDHEMDYEITASPKSTLIGRTAFSLNNKMDNGVNQTLWFTADIEVWVDVVLASRSLKGKQIINEDDVYTGKQDIGGLPAGYIDKLEDVVGKRLKRFIGGNRPVTGENLEEPPLLKRGDKVFIVAESETVKVTAMGVASEDGYRNRPVKVVNMQSKREVFGDVIDSGTIKVRW